jgi:hypothetical protein
MKDLVGTRHAAKLIARMSGHSRLQCGTARSRTDGLEARAFLWGRENATTNAAGTCRALRRGRRARVLRYGGEGRGAGIPLEPFHKLHSPGLPLLADPAAAPREDDDDDATPEPAGAAFAPAAFAGVIAVWRGGFLVERAAAP